MASAKSGGARGGGGKGGSGYSPREASELATKTGTAIQVVPKGSDNKGYQLYAPDDGLGTAIVRAKTKAELVAVQRTLVREKIDFSGGRAIPPVKQPKESRKSYDERRRQWMDIVNRTARALRENHPQARRGYPI